MDEQKDLSVSNEDVLDNNNSSVNDEVPNVEENAGTSNGNDDVRKAGNGYRGLASSNREAFSRGLSDNYNERIARNKARVNESKANAANSKKEVETDNGVEEKDKTKLDKVKDKADVLKSKAELASSKIDKARAGMYAVTNPKEAAKMVVKAKIRAWILASIVPITIGLMSMFVLFVGVLFILGLFDFESQASGGNGNISFYSKAGDALYDGSYTRSDFINAVENYNPPNVTTSNNHTLEWGYNRFFIPNAGNFFDIATSYGLDPRFIFCIGIHESYFGTSSIALSKGNFFGWGAYDDSPYESALTFYDMSNGIDTVSRGISRNYVNPEGAYYKTIQNRGGDPTTIAGVGTVYASDKGWADKVKAHMVNIFNVSYENDVSVITDFKKLSSYPLKGGETKFLRGSLTSSEITNLNNYISNSVRSNGYGTGDGVAAAGQSLVDGLYQLGYRLPYVWGGKFRVGAPFNASGNSVGLDCSGFVTWSIVNGCNPDFPYHTSNGFYDDITTNTTTIAKAKPGDIMVKIGHVRLVLYSNGTSIVTAEAFSSDMGVIFNSYSSMGTGYKILDMSSWYANNCKG